MESQNDPYIEADTRWLNLMLRIGREQTERFNNNPDTYTEVLATAQSTRLLMRWVYHVVTGKKLLQPIGDLPEEEKREIWDFVLEKCLQYTKNKTILKEIAMVFYVMNYFNKEATKPC